MRRTPFFGTVSDTEIRSMRIFVKIVECGGLSAAQSELGIERSTISRQLSNLETRFGLRLCHRGRSGFHLTQHGEQAHGHIQRFLSAADELSNQIAGISDRLDGQLDIGLMDYTFCNPRNPLLNIITDFRNRAPNVVINLSVGSPRDIGRKVVDGLLHIGVMVSDDVLPELESQILFQEVGGLFAGGNHPIANKVRSGEKVTENDVYDHQVIFRGYRETSLQNSIKSKFQRGPVILETEAVEALICSGSYLGFLPINVGMVNSDLRVEVLPEIFRNNFPVRLLRRRNRRLSPVLREFLNVLGAGMARD